MDLRNSAGRSRRNNDSPTPRSPSIPPGNVYKPDRALATQFTISKSNDQPARRALVLGPLGASHKTMTMPNHNAIVTNTNIPNTIKAPIRAPLTLLSSFKGPRRHLPPSLRLQHHQRRRKMKRAKRFSALPARALRSSRPPMLLCAVSYHCVSRLAPSAASLEVDAWLAGAAD